jgi:uncharacterized damage-inducible protein DinB
MQQFYQDYLDTLEALHNDWKKAIAGLSVEALDWVPGREMNSLCVLVVHTMGATRYWVGDVAGQIPSNRVRAAEFQAHGLDEAALKQKLDDTFAFVRSVLEKLSLQDLEAARTSANHPGEKFNVGGSIAHALDHTGLHLGHAQITRQLWDHNYG